MLKKVFWATFFIAFGLVGSYLLYPPTREAFLPAVELKISLPCEKSIYYSLGSFDNRFGISQSEFLEIVKQAASIWGNLIDKELFAYSPDGPLKINLVYDYRQESTEKLKELGIIISDDKNTYDRLKAQYDSFISLYNRQTKQLNSLIDSYNEQKAAYEAEVNMWNNKGGAPQKIFDRLNAEKEQLNSLANQLNQMADKLNSLTDNINLIVSNLNQLAARLNLNVQNYNYLGDKTGSSFVEGLYQKDQNGESITIYQFDNKEKLLRVLAHEFGHALGLNHTDNPNDIMYKINEGPNEKPTINDLNQLKAACLIK
jgi:predicted Zn-dependent protease